MNMKKRMVGVLCVALVSASLAAFPSCEQERGEEVTTALPGIESGSEGVTTSEGTPMDTASPEITAEETQSDTDSLGVSAEEAVEIAADFWNIRAGDVDPDTGYRYALFPVENQTENPNVHVIMLKWLVEGTHYSTVDEIWVDRHTGEILRPDWYKTVYVDLFERALCNEYALYLQDEENPVFLKDCRTPYLQAPLTEIWEEIEYAYPDVDGDGIDECALLCGVDIFILRGHEGKGYLYAYPFRSMSTLYADGSFSWHSVSGYGRSCLLFDGAVPIIRNLWRVERGEDGETEVAYYVGDRQVTKEELDTFAETCSDTPVTWTKLDIPLFTDGK